MKRFLSVVLSIALLVCAIPSMSVFAAERVDEVNGVKFGFRLVKSSYGTSAALQTIETKGVKNVVMPDVVYANGGTEYKVSSIDTYAFRNNTTMETFKLNQYCQSIDDFVFLGCSNLKSIDFNNNTNITRIGQGAFQNSGLESIELPFRLSYVGANAFDSCKKLKTFKAGFGLTTLETGALKNCTALETVYLNASLTKIADKAIGYSGTDVLNENLTIVAPKDTIAMKYAQDNGFKYKYDISGAFANDIKDKKYTGKAITPAVTVKQSGTTLVKGVDYTVSYSKNVKPGFAKVTITGIGNYTGTLTTTFFIKPIVKKVTGVKTSVKKKKMTVKWKKLKDISGYQIVYSTKKNFKGKKTVTAGKKLTSKKINKTLKKGKYFVKVRAYKTISGRKTYGEYSKVVTRKVK